MLIIFHEQSDGTTLIMGRNYPFYFHKICFSVTYAKGNIKGSPEASFLREFEQLLLWLPWKYFTQLGTFLNKTI